NHIKSEFEIQLPSSLISRIEKLESFKCNNNNDNESIISAMQDDITTEISRIENNIFMFLESITRFYTTRGKLN
ncbi:2490_t:CDS:2, partial [Entrophospora sp. SA101]